MKKLIIAIIITALMVCALVSCAEENNESSVNESLSNESKAEQNESVNESTVLEDESKETGESDILDESSVADESDDSVDVSEDQPENDQANTEDTSGFKAEFTTMEELDELEKYPDYNWLKSGEGLLVVFTAEKPLYSVQLHSIVTDIDIETDEITHTIVDSGVYRGEINKDVAAAARLSFPSNFPSNAISFIDEAGNLHFYVLSESMKDGSLIYAKSDFDGLIFTAQLADYEDDYEEMGYNIFLDNIFDDAKPSIIFRTTETISDFKIYDLDITEHWNNGTDGPLYKIEKELYSLTELTPDKPLAAEILFAGIVPQRAVSYKDSEGIVRYFTLDISLKDGTLIFAETELEIE